MLKNSINQSKDLLINLAACSNYRVAQENGQRIFGPPLDWTEDYLIPEKGTEVFVGKIPRDCFENELIPLFEKPGKIYKMRLMIDFTGKNRGYGFVQYFNKQDAKRAVEMLNKFEIRKKWPIGVMLSRNNNRLFFGNLPNNITRNEMINEVAKYTSGIKNAIYYGGPHRANGFGFVEYENHKMTALARRKFFPGSILLFGRQPKVDWAKSEEDNIEEGNPANRSVLYVRFFKPVTTEEELKQFFCINYNGRILNVSKAKKIRNFAFIHYQTSEEAQKAYDYFQSIDLGLTPINDVEQELEIKWAKNKSISSSPTPNTQLSSSVSRSSPKSREICPTSQQQQQQQHQQQSQQLSSIQQQPSPPNNHLKTNSNITPPTNPNDQQHSFFNIFGCNDNRFDQFANYDQFAFNVSKFIYT